MIDVAADLLQAAERIDSKNWGCCIALETWKASQYFQDLFYPYDDYSEGLEDEPRRNWEGWMYCDSERPTRDAKKVQRRRVLALLLTREIYLSERRTTGRK